MGSMDRLNVNVTSEKDEVEKSHKETQLGYMYRRKTYSIVDYRDYREYLPICDSRNTKKRADSHESEFVARATSEYLRWYIQHVQHSEIIWEGPLEIQHGEKSGMLLNRVVTMTQEVLKRRTQTRIKHDFRASKHTKI